MLTNINQSGANAGGDIVGRDQYKIIVQAASPELINTIIEAEAERHRKRRWFAEYDRLAEARKLAVRLIEGDFASGGAEVRGRALAWCARTLAGAAHLREAEAALTKASQLSGSTEAKLAEAIILSQKGCKQEALSLLAKIELPAAKTASLLVVARHEGTSGALAWAQKAALTPDQFDPEGKFLILSQQLELGRWDDAATTARSSDRQEFWSVTPILKFSVAMANLLQAVPEEMRHGVRQQVPFRCRDFGLASNLSGMESRRVAREGFETAAAIFSNLELPQASSTAQEYALWLKLEDPAARQAARAWLREALRDTYKSLRWVRYAAQYDEKLDVDAVCAEIEREIAVNGGATPETSAARLCLALMQNSYGEVASYLSTHTDELAANLDPKALAALEVEMLSRSGQREQAAEKLRAARSLGLDSAEEARLEHLLDESGADAVAVCRANFERTDSLVDLVTLVGLLEDREDWLSTSEYALAWFEKTKSLVSAEKCLGSIAKSRKAGDVLLFLRKYPNLTHQSERIKSIRCWALYCDGHVVEAQKFLNEIGSTCDCANRRELRHAIALALGDWNEISAIVADEHQHRNDRPADAYLGRHSLPYKSMLQPPKTFCMQLPKEARMIRPS